jgi:hypothetical protein
LKVKIMVMSNYEGVQIIFYLIDNQYIIVT